MNRITKLFGRKDDETVNAAAEEHARAAAPADAPAASAAEQSFSNLAEGDFGLMFTFDDGSAQTFTTLPITIGRDPQNALVLHDPSVSAQHAYISYDERLQKVCIFDLDSSNGLYINDQPTRKNVLQDDARLRLGNVLLTFRDTGYIHEI